MRSGWLERLWRFLSQPFTSAETARHVTAQGLGFTVDGLNVDAARRQAKLGRDYGRTAQTPQRLKKLNQGEITLSPHPSWAGDYTNWVADPFDDRNWRFQFQTLRWINPYLWDALDGNEESEAEWKRIVHSWAAHNTPPHRARDDYAWMDMTDGNRAIQISIGAPLIDVYEHWFVDLLVEHRNWLIDDINIVQGNHGLHQNLGLFVVAAVLNDRTGIEKSIERLAEQLLAAFDDKGLNDEGSVGYHQMNLIWWFEAKRRLELEGYSFPPNAGERLEQASRTMGNLLLPDGTMPQIGDGNRGKGRHGLHPFLDQVNKGEIREKDLPIFHHYRNGLTILRSGWGETRPFKEESHTILRHGRDLLRHSHDDRGSVHIYTAGRRWITDGGFHSYQQNDPDRLYTKSRLAHSLVDLPNQEHDTTGEVAVLLTENSDELQSVEICDDNFEASIWKRRVVFLPKQHIWIIWDRIFSADVEQVQQQWLLDKGIAVDKLTDDHVALDDQNGKLHMLWLGDQPRLDIAVGNPKSESKRGLIGLQWKKMSSTSSIHAIFHAKNVESVVVISKSDESDLSVNVTNHKPMDCFELALRNLNQSYHLKLQQDSTQLFPKN